MQHLAIAPGAGVGLRNARSVPNRLRMQAQVLAVYKVGAAHFLVVLAIVSVFSASTDNHASASTSTSASTCSCLVSCMGVAIVAVLPSLPFLLLGLVALSS